MDDLRRLIGGFQVSQAIHVAATLGIADLLREGPRASDELAEATDTVAPTLYRLLRALASVGVLREEDGRLFTLTPLGEHLRTDHPQSLHGWAAFVGRPYFWGAWAELLHSVRTGENAFRHVYGTDVWSYRAEHPEESAIFDRAMTSLTSSQDRALVETYDFDRFATVVDVGGGEGTRVADDQQQGAATSTTQFTVTSKSNGNLTAFVDSSNARDATRAQRRQHRPVPNGRPSDPGAGCSPTT